jgi:hypothetical protein
VKHVTSTTDASANTEQKTAKAAARELRFQAAMPAIPGVPTQRKRQIKLSSRQATLAFCALIALISGGVWMAARKPHAAVVLVPDPPVPDLPPAEPINDTATSPVPATNEIGTIEEFARPWSVKKFTYTSLMTHARVPAIAIRLPVGDGHSSESYWAISLQVPYGHCELEYVTDENALAQRFGFHATHPMIADACSGTIYDPLRVTTMSDGAWARGEIVQGAGVSPPLQVEILIEGDKIVAGRSED